MEYREGQTATNPKTGQKVIYKGGQWVNAGAAPGKANPAEIKQGITNRNQLADLNAIDKQLGRVEQLYNENFKGVGPGSLLEYLPTQKSQQFNSANRFLSTMMKPLIRAPGEGAWTDADQARLDSLALSNRRMDGDNEEALRGIRTLIEERRKKHGATPQSGWKVTRIK